MAAWRKWRRQLSAWHLYRRLSAWLFVAGNISMPSAYQWLSAVWLAGVFVKMASIGVMAVGAISWRKCEIFVSSDGIYSVWL